MDVLSTLHDDEVVADSEDEENPFGLQILQMNPDSVLNSRSSFRHSDFTRSVFCANDIS
jgi:hypothetical protein